MLSRDGSVMSSSKQVTSEAEFRLKSYVQVYSRLQSDPETSCLLERQNIFQDL